MFEREQECDSAFDEVPNPVEPSFPQDKVFLVLGALIVLIIVLVVTAFYFANSNSAPPVDPLRAAQAKDQAAATQINQNMAAINEAAAAEQLDQRARLHALELRVVTACIDRGGVPIQLNGNIDCKLLPK